MSNKKRHNSFSRLPPTGKSQKKLLPNTKKEIEVNRLTLGFMNYENLKHLYNEP